MTIEMSELADRVAELGERLRAGEVVTLTDAGATLGTVTPKANERSSRTGRLGCAPGVVGDIPADFNDPLPDEFWLGGRP